jgi:hypothetical protein
MNQALYAHMNNKRKMKKKKETCTHQRSCHIPNLATTCLPSPAKFVSCLYWHLPCGLGEAA